MSGIYCFLIIDLRDYAERLNSRKETFRALTRTICTNFSNFAKFSFGANNSGFFLFISEIIRIFAAIIYY